MTNPGAKIKWIYYLQSIMAFRSCSAAWKTILQYGTNSLTISRDEDRSR
jgi:hypothetical protein